MQNIFAIVIFLYCTMVASSAGTFGTFTRQLVSSIYIIATNNLLNEIYFPQKQCIDFRFLRFFFLKVWLDRNFLQGSNHRDQLEGVDLKVQTARCIWIVTIVSTLKTKQTQKIHFVTMVVVSSNDIRHIHAKKMFTSWHH